MRSNLEKIQKISLVRAIREINFAESKQKIASVLTPQELVAAETNSKKVFIYWISYVSQKHLVTGFIVEPRRGNNLPCIIYNRGGSGDFGMIKLGGLFLTLAEFALRDYVVIASQYSGNNGGEGKDEMGGDDLYDVLNLYKILKQYPRA